MFAINIGLGILFHQMIPWCWIIRQNFTQTPPPPHSICIVSWWCQFERLSCLCYLIIVLSVHWVNKLNHCHQLFDHVHNLDMNWSILDTAGLGFFFYFPVNNSGWTCYYHLQGFFSPLGLCFMFTSFYYKLPWEPFSSWESIHTGTVLTRDLLSPTARTIILRLWTSFSVQYVHTSTMIPIIFMAYFRLRPLLSLLYLWLQSKLVF